MVARCEEELPRCLIADSCCSRLIKGKACVLASGIGRDRPDANPVDHQRSVRQPGEKSEPCPVVDAAVATSEEVFRVHSPIVLEEPPAAEHHRVGRCLLYTSPSPRDRTRSRMPSS